jgi:diguanylate cyclase (GGDEF)-like protein
VASCAGLPETTGSEIENLQRELAAMRKELAMLRMANAELERVIVRDTLTPLYNRRHFLSIVNDRINRMERYGSRSVVMFIDVDRMKHINDAFGHAAGDFALIHVAELIATAIRSTDVAARLGGDEFALILDEIDEDQANHKMTALDALIRETSCLFDGKALPVTASFGCTEIKAGDTEGTILGRADMAMYDNKRRNRDACPNVTDQRSDR